MQPRHLLLVAANQCRKLRHRRSLVLVTLILVLCLVMVSFKMQDALTQMNTRAQVGKYMAWWSLVCENSTRGLREERSRKEGGLPLCACVDKYPVFTDGLAMLGKAPSSLPLDATCYCSPHYLLLINMLFIIHFSSSVFPLKISVVVTSNNMKSM